jgi:hypothetical protein
LIQFTPRSPNAAKALTNWTRKANYLTGENVKYQTYISALQRAGLKKNEIESEKIGQIDDGVASEDEFLIVDPVHGDLDRE